MCRLFKSVDDWVDYHAETLIVVMGAFITVGLWILTLRVLGVL